MRIWMRSLVSLFVITGTGYLLDRLLRHEGVSRRDLLVFSDVLVGIVAAFLIHILTLHEEQKRRFVEQRLKVTAEMNHHIRNALQVIAYQSYMRQEEPVAEIDQAVTRITWTLQEVLPQIPDLSSHLTNEDPLSQAGRQQPH